MILVEELQGLQRGQCRVGLRWPVDGLRSITLWNGPQMSCPDARPPSLRGGAQLSAGSQSSQSPQIRASLLSNPHYFFHHELNRYKFLNSPPIFIYLFMCKRRHHLPSVKRRGIITDRQREVTVRSGFGDCSSLPPQPGGQVAARLLVGVGTVSPCPACLRFGGIACLRIFSIL